jgi:uncharacterized protein
MKPILSDERVELLDVLRGLAIFGMFTVNMTVDSVWSDNLREMELALLDFVALVFVDLFTKGKFITIFSFRRSFGLLIIGVLGLACTLNTWILVDYAIIGLGLLLFLKRSPRTILVMLLFLKRSPRTILVTGIAMILLGNIFGWIIPEYLELSKEEAGSQSTSLPEMPDENVFRDGDFKQISLHWLQMLWDAFTDWRYYASEVRWLGIMLLGLYVASRGAVWDPSVRRSLAKKTLPWLIGVGFFGCLIWVVMADFARVDETSVYLVFGHIAAWPIGMPLLGLGYAAAITLLTEHESWQPRLASLAAVGRMALSNYIFTALVAAFIGASWGLGLYGRLAVSVSLLIVLAAFLTQVLASRWWMARYLFGPAEWASQPGVS